MSSSFDSQKQESLKKRRQEPSNRPSSSPSCLNMPPNFYNRLLMNKTTQQTLLPACSLNISGNYNYPNNNNNNNNKKLLQGFSSGFDDDDLVSSVVPPVTVVLEGRSICQRISLHKHGSYQSLAKSLRQMFVDCEDLSAASSNYNGDNNDHHLDLSNAIPGHLIAYEDMENDLLLVGDLSWKDFVRVAKRIRILPVKQRSNKKKDEFKN